MPAFHHLAKDPTLVGTYKKATLCREEAAAADAAVGTGATAADPPSAADIADDNAAAVDGEGPYPVGDRVPSLAKAWEACPGSHLQRALTRVLHIAAFYTLVNDDELPLSTRCRLSQCTQFGAGRFMTAMPTSKDRVLSDQAYLTNWWHVGGMTQGALRAPACCAARCPTHGPRAVFNAAEAAEFAEGWHTLTCGACKWLCRHNAVGSAVQTECYGPAGYSFDTTGEAVNVHLDSQKRVDAIARNPYKADAPDAIDFTIGMPMGKSYLSVDATLDPTYVTAKLERDKIHKHASKAKELGMQFMPIAFTTYGGMGDEFLKKRWRPFFKELMAEELKAGGKGWKTRKRQQRALEKLSIVLARENGAMIARATSWQQAVATRP